MQQALPNGAPPTPFGIHEQTHEPSFVYCCHCLSPCFRHSFYHRRSSYHHQSQAFYHPSCYPHRCAVDYVWDLDVVAQDSWCQQLVMSAMPESLVCIPNIWHSPHEMDRVASLEV